MIDEIAWIGVSALTVILSLVALYYALKRTSYNEETLSVAKESLEIQKKQLKIKKTMLKESRKYWSGWVSRSEDIALSLKREANKMFLANMIDTEGCIAIGRKKRKDYEKTGLTSLSPTVDFSNSSKLLVEKYKQLSRGNGKMEIFMGTNKMMYRFRINRHEEILKLLLPIHEYLIVKRKQAIFMIEFCRLRMQHSRTRYSKKERELARKITDFNKS